MEKIRICEVGPRDGFQNIQDFIATQTKLDVIDAIVEAGIRDVQITSFVSPKAIPQMRDAKEVAQACLEKYSDCHFFALVPNLRGAETAWECGIRSISYVVSLSARHNQANINRTHRESFEELEKIISAYPDMHICLDLATTFGCPFEGKKWVDEVLAFLDNYVALGIKEINLCDTIGIADPKQLRQTIAGVKTAYPHVGLQVHIHDTRNMGMVNTLAAIESGVTTVQSTLGGLGGCPFAPGASGNLATEDLVYMLTEMGYPLGIDCGRIIQSAKQLYQMLPNGVFSGHQLHIGN